MPRMGTGALASTSFFVLSVVNRGLTPEEVPAPPSQDRKGLPPQAMLWPQHAFPGSGAQIQWFRPAYCPLTLELGLQEVVHVHRHALLCTGTQTCLDKMGRTFSFVSGLGGCLAKQGEGSYL